MGWKSGVLAAAMRGDDRASCSWARDCGVDALQDFGGARPMLPVGPSRSSSAAAGLARWRALGCAARARRRRRPRTAAPVRAGRSPVNAAVCVILIGAALLCLDRRPNLADALRARRRADRRARAARVPLRRPRAAARAALLAAHADGRADRASPCSRSAPGCWRRAPQGGLAGAVPQRRSGRRARAPARARGRSSSRRARVPEPTSASAHGVFGTREGLALLGAALS